LLSSAGVAAVLATGVVGGGDTNHGPREVAHSFFDGKVEREPSRGGVESDVPDRAALARPVPPSARDRPVPILMYHLVSDPPPNAPFPNLYVSAFDFAQQMEWLKRRGYTGVTLRAAYDLWTRGVPLPRRPVVISFDDGYRSVWGTAQPVLQRLGWPGVLNLELNVLHNTRQGGLRKRMVRELVAARWEVDSHTVSHPDLTKVDPGRLRDELVRSRAAIRRTFGEPADFFCYPAGRYDAAVVAAVRRAGYLAATTTRFGSATPDRMFTLNRVRINREDGLTGFKQKLGRLARGDA
ncbi:MAG TPA: polysaccharide deacetylase family protein, partial [Thermoleophilaceae bacterium]|nr:polysaccharide deacetylase family protein [Thermoleophilaceae bacterium]